MVSHARRVDARRLSREPIAYELTLVGGSTILFLVSGSGSRANLSDKDLVESVLRELSEAADKWEALVAQAEAVTYSVDLGDVYAVANSDGRLIKLTLHPGVMTGYGHGELADRLNLAITALREEAEAENRASYGGPCTDGAYALIAQARLTGPPRWSHRSSLREGTCLLPTS